MATPCFVIATKRHKKARRAGARRQQHGPIPIAASLVSSSDEAGHPGPALMKKGQPPHIIATHSYPIGVSEDAEYISETIQLQAGDKLILYTDGVVEALSSRDIPFGDERFLKTLKRNQSKSIDECLDAVIKSLENWACHVNLRDDLFLVGIEVQG